MKYSIHINQNRAIEWELSTSEAVVFSWIYELASWADKLIYNENTYYFANRSKACEELPIVTDKPDTMYRIYKSLEKKGLVSMATINKNDYISITEKGKQWYYEDELPKLGKKSEETRKKIRENSEKNPTDNNISNNINNNNKEISTNVDTKKEKTAYEKFNDWLSDNAPNVCKLSKQMTEEQFNTARDKYSFDQMSYILLQMENYKGIHKKYTSVYLTFNNWAKREYGNK